MTSELVNVTGAERILVQTSKGILLTDLPFELRFRLSDKAKEELRQIDERQARAISTANQFLFD